jgi:hypothetical protein
MVAIMIFARFALQLAIAAVLLLASGALTAPAARADRPKRGRHLQPKCRWASYTNAVRRVFRLFGRLKSFSSTAMLPRPRKPPPTTGQIDGTPCAMAGCDAVLDLALLFKRVESIHRLRA